MDVRPSEEQELLRAMVRRFLANRSSAADAGRGPMDAADWRELGALGVLAATLPDNAGGMDAAPQDAAIVAEELGRACAITPYAEGILAAADLVARFAPPAQADRWAIPAARGECRLALVTGDVALDHGRLDGRASFVPWAAEADGYLVLAGGQAVVVAADATGLAITPHRLADGSVAGTLAFAGSTGDGFPVPPAAAEAAVALARLGHVAEMVGIMASLQDQSADHARQRRQFGVAIASFQAVQHKLARMFVRLEQSRSILFKASLASRDDPGFPRLVLGAKAYVADAAMALAEDAVQIHGGMGVTDELVVGRALRRVMVLARLLGSADAARRALAA